MVIIYTTK